MLLLNHSHCETSFLLFLFSIVVLSAPSLVKVTSLVLLTISIWQIMANSTSLKNHNECVDLKLDNTCIVNCYVCTFRIVILSEDICRLSNHLNWSSIHCLKLSHFVKHSAYIMSYKMHYKFWSAMECNQNNKKTVQ